MENIIINKLENEIERLIEELTKLQPGTDEYVGITETINKLYGTLNKEKELSLNERKLNAEIDKNDNDYTLRDRQLDIESDKDENALINNREARLLQESMNEADRDIQVKTLQDSKLWNGVKTGVEIFSITLPIAFYGVWMKRGLEFEKEGTFTSNMVKGLFGKIKPTR